MTADSRPERRISTSAIRLGPADRSAGKSHRPAVLWFTGLSGSGKTTLAGCVEARLADEFRAHTFLLDGDSLRAGLCRDLGFSDADRAENVRRAGEVARLFYDAGLIVLAALISPFRSDRDRVRALFPSGAFFEIFVDCPLEICAQRDPKGLYRLAQQGHIQQFTGLTSAYQPPLHPELAVDTARLSTAEAAQRVLDLLVGEGVLQPRPHP